MSKKLLPLLALALLAACAEPPTGISVTDPPRTVQPTPVDPPVQHPCPALRQAGRIAGLPVAPLNQCPALP
jgi:hypothetical protein